MASTNRWLRDILSFYISLEKQIATFQYHEIACVLSQSRISIMAFWNRWLNIEFVDYLSDHKDSLEDGHCSASSVWGKATKILNIMNTPNRRKILYMAWRRNKNGIRNLLADREFGDSNGDKNTQSEQYGDQFPFHRTDDSNDEDSALEEFLTSGVNNEDNNDTLSDEIPVMSKNFSRHVHKDSDRSTKDDVKQSSSSSECDLSDNPGMSMKFHRHVDMDVDSHHSADDRMQIPENTLASEQHLTDETQYSPDHLFCICRKPNQSSIRVLHTMP